MDRDEMIDWVMAHPFDAADELARLRDVTTWRTDWEHAPTEGQFLVCWSTGEFDTIGLQEYNEIMGYGEPPARGWCPLWPAPIAEK